MNSFLKFLILFIFDIICLKTEEIKPLTTLIVSYNETRFIRIDDFFNNATQNFSVSNPNKSIFDVSLSDSFSILMANKQGFMKFGSIIKLENLKAIKSEIILYENNFILLSWNDFQNVGRIDIIECKRKMIRPLDIIDKPEEKCFSYSMVDDINCYDVKEIDSPSTLYNATILVECEYKTTTKAIQFIAVYGIKTNSYNLESKIDFLTFLNDDGLQINIPGKTANKFCERKIKISNKNIFYRYCSYSSLSNQTRDASQLILQKLIFNFTTSYQIYLLQSIAMNETNIEHIEIVNNNYLLIMESSENLKVLNLTNMSKPSYIYTYNNTQTKNVGVYKFDDNHYFFLTNESLSALSLDRYLTLTQDLKIDLQEDINPSSFFFSTDYFFVVYNNRTKIYSNYIGGKQQQIENSAFFIYLDPGLLNFMLGFDEKVSKNSFITLHEFQRNSFSYAWSVNITKLDKKKLSLFCCNKTILPYLKSLDKFYFYLLIYKNTETIQNATIRIVYWDINDNNLYFGNKIYPELNGNKSNYYEFDNENIYIPYKRNLVLGQMIIMNLRKSSPSSKNSIFLKNIKSFMFDENFFQPYRFTFEILKSKLLYLNIEINSSLILNIYFQNSRDYYFTIISCLFSRDYETIQDCEIPLLIRNIQQIKKQTKFYSFIIYQNVQNQIYWSNNKNDANHYLLIKDMSCLDYETNEFLNLLFCVESGGNFAYGILSVTNKLLTFGFRQSLPIDYYNPYSLNNRIVTDLLTDQNCLILFSPPRIQFYEVSYKKNDHDPASTVRILYRNFRKADLDSNLFIYKETKTSNFMMIIKRDNCIKEYSLENKYQPIFVRNYPTFDYQIDNTFGFMDGNFLYLRMQKDRKVFLFIYDAEQFTSNLIKRKIDLDPDVFLAPIKFVRPQNAALISDEFLQISRQSCVLLASKSNISLLLFGDYDIYGNIKQIFPDNKIDKSVPFSYHLITSFENTIMKAKLIYDLLINITFTNSIIKTKEINLTYCINQSDFLNIKFNNKFSGPIENYKVSDENIEINPYLKHELDFQEYSQNNMTGSFIKVLTKHFFLVVLTQKKILFLDISQGYRTINEFPVPYSVSCYDIIMHRLHFDLYAFCTKISNKEFSVFYFNLTSISSEPMKPRKLLEFNDFLKEYVAVALGKNHLFFLTNEEIIISNKSKINAIYIFNTSNIDNINFKPTLIGKINDVFFNQKDFNLVNALDMQIFSVLFNVTITQKNFYGAVIIFNQKFEYLLLEVYDGDQEKDSYIKKLDWKSDYNFSDIIYSNSMNQEFSFYSISILDEVQYLDKENEIYDYPDFNFNILVSSCEHIYEYKIQSKFFNKTLTFLYEKFYSCIFNINTRPKKKMGFVGSFCIQDVIQNGNKEPNFNYFVLHKEIDVNPLTRRVNPVFALPIFLKNYNLQLIVNSNLVSIVLPSFSNLFSVYSLSNYIFLNKTWMYEKSQANSIRLTAYNQVSSADIEICTFKTENINNRYIIVLSILLPALLLIFLAVGIRFYIIKKRKDREDEYNQILIEEDYYKINNGSMMINVKDSSTYTNSMCVKRTGSYIINAKKKIEKWK